MMKTTKKSFVVLLTYVSLLTPAASMDPVLANIQSPDSVGNSIDDHGNITWADIPQGEPYKADAEYSDGGMGPLFDFSRSFINTCLQKGFPYGKSYLRFDFAESGNILIRGVSFFRALPGPQVSVR